MAVYFEGWCDDVRVEGEYSPSIQAAANSFATVWNNLCGGVGELPEIITWTANDGLNFSETNIPFVQILVEEGSIVEGSVAWQLVQNPDQPSPDADPSLSFLAACGLVLCYGLGLIGGQQR